MKKFLLFGICSLFIMDSCADKKGIVLQIPRRITVGKPFNVDIINHTSTDFLFPIRIRNDSVIIFDNVQTPYMFRAIVTKDQDTIPIGSTFIDDLFPPSYDALATKNHKEYKRLRSVEEQKEKEENKRYLSTYHLVKIPAGRKKAIRMLYKNEYNYTTFSATTQNIKPHYRYKLRVTYLSTKWRNLNNHDSIYFGSLLSNNATLFKE